MAAMRNPKVVAETKCTASTACSPRPCRSGVSEIVGDGGVVGKNAKRIAIAPAMHVRRFSRILSTSRPSPSR
jgi:hypothetical protein